MDDKELLEEGPNKDLHVQNILDPLSNNVKEKTNLDNAVESAKQYYDFIIDNDNTLNKETKKSYKKRINELANGYQTAKKAKNDENKKYRYHLNNLKNKVEKTLLDTEKIVFINITYIGIRGIFKVEKKHTKNLSMNDDYLKNVKANVEQSILEKRNASKKTKYSNLRLDRILQSSENTDPNVLREKNGRLNTLLYNAAHYDIGNNVLDRGGEICRKMLQMFSSTKKDINNTPISKKENPKKTSMKKRQVRRKGI